MIIVSQDKTEIFNFNNIFRLYVDTWNSEEFATEPDCWCIKAEKSQDNLICAFLGQYKTEERAKEVLEKIANRYIATECFRTTVNRLTDEMGAFAMDHTFIFKMPKE